MGLHDSAVRQHLAKLVGAELVVDERDPMPARGRPRTVYRGVPGVLGVWRTENHFERLAGLLIEALKTGEPVRDVGREAGRSVAASAAEAMPTRPPLAMLVDMVAASVLMAMGMMMLPPVVISLPFKIMLFVLVDGWTLLVGSLVKSFG